MSEAEYQLWTPGERCQLLFIFCRWILPMVLDSWLKGI